jgi:hypothetical protein
MTKTDDAKLLVLEVGKQSAKRIKALKRGEGALADEVHAAVVAEAQVPEDALVVVMLYRVKRKKARGIASMLGLV